MAPEEFERLVSAAFDLIPEEFRSRMENIAVIVEPGPTAHQPLSVTAFQLSYLTHSETQSPSHARNLHAPSPTIWSEDKPVTTLTPQQHRVIAAIAAGSTITQAASTENIHRNTIGNWRRTNPDFARELEFAIQQYRDYWQEQATALVPQAIRAIEDCLTNLKSSPSLRFRAATLIVKMATQTKLASFIAIGQTAPEMAEPAQACTTEPELASFIPTPEASDSKDNPDPNDKAFNIRQAAKDFVHAQRCTKPQPIRATPQPGRNEPCPCNSGLKFKRCCLNKRETALHQAAA